MSNLSREVLPAAPPAPPPSQSLPRGDRVPPWLPLIALVLISAGAVVATAWSDDEPESSQIRAADESTESTGDHDEVTTTRPSPTSPAASMQTTSSEPTVNISALQGSYIVQLASRPVDEFTFSEVRSEAAEYSSVDAQVLRSDDFSPALRAGFWVIFVGPTGSREAAFDRLDEIRSLVPDDAHVRHLDPTSVSVSPPSRGELRRASLREEDLRPAWAFAGQDEGGIVFPCGTDRRLTAPTSTARMFELEIEGESFATLSNSLYGFGAGEAQGQFDSYRSTAQSCTRYTITADDGEVFEVTLDIIEDRGGRLGLEYEFFSPRFGESVFELEYVGVTAEALVFLNLISDQASTVSDQRDATELLDLVEARLGQSV